MHWTGQSFFVTILATVICGALNFTDFPHNQEVLHSPSYPHLMHVHTQIKWNIWGYFCNKIIISYNVERPTPLNSHQPVTALLFFIYRDYPNLFTLSHTHSSSNNGSSTEALSCSHCLRRHCFRHHRIWT